MMKKAGGPSFMNCSFLLLHFSKGSIRSVCVTQRQRQPENCEYFRFEEEQYTVLETLPFINICLLYTSDAADE